MDELQPAQPSAEIIAKGYEPAGIHFWTLLGVMLIIVMVIAVFMGVAAWMIVALTRHDLAIENVPSAVATPAVNNGLPPLQPSPAHNTIAAEDLIQMRQHEADVFKRLGWKPDADGSFHPPDEVVAAVAARQAAGK